MLTDAKVRNVKPADKPFRLTDAGGLFLWVTPAGGKIWRLRYEYQRKEKLISLGPYPEIPLGQARELRDEAKAQLRGGKDPSAQRKLDRVKTATATATTFEGVARDWHALLRPTWTERHADDVIKSLERAAFPVLGALPIGEIEPPVVVGVLRAVEAGGAPETARRLRQRISAVFAYAIAHGLAKHDPAHLARGVLAPMKKGRQPAITQLEPLREMLRAAEAIPAHPVTRLALRFLALTAVRPGELRGARWDEIVGLDGASPLWEIPAERMKMKVAHAVPLSRQAVAVIEATRPFTARHPLVFPNSRHAHHPLSENALGYLLNRAGYHGHHVPHGFRASFSSVMNEAFRADRQIIDLMLAHSPKDEIEGAYNRALHADRRRELAQAWADMLLEGFPNPSDLAPLARR
ncbi:phage integrase central domain-containing protein [Acidocella sp.]|uniref:tyrosine-type recombinase/integrase n=1 Tax=Acidocella sp. TaxID=50710 RepID=UPI00262A9A47|nr:integrase arm-type DNA-binding domain-containing protein [Acidocella sp.]